MKDDVIEQAAIALAEADGQSRHDVVWNFDDEGRKTVSEPAWVYYVPSAQALADAGLLARPMDGVALDRLQELAEERGYHRGFHLGWDAALDFVKGKN